MLKWPDLRQFARSQRCPLFLWAAIACWLIFWSPVQGQDVDSAAIQSPADLWRGYDPEALPLDTTSIKTWTQDGVEFESLRYTSEVIDGVPIRVYAITGAPSGGERRAGILHIHGGGQTASLEWVRFWTKRGYVCATFDFCGPWANRTDVTDWGPLKQGNMQSAAGGLQVHPTPRESSWYHWTIASRRALTLLAKRPQVDPARLGIFGISMGGTLTWMVSGSDQRVKAAAAIYGCGYNYDRRNFEWGHPPVTDDLKTFQRVVSAEAHAPYVNCPLLFLDATNDFHGLMDRAYDSLRAAPGVTRAIFTPRVNHHIAPEDGKDLPLWMDWQLNGGPAFPDTPNLTVDLDNSRIPAGKVMAGDPKEVSNVEIFYTLGNKRPNARFWRRVPTELRGTVWTASLPVMDAWDDVRAFANVSYRSGVRLSTGLQRQIPAQTGKAKSTLERSTEITHGPDGLDHWYFTNSYTDPMLDWTYLQSAVDPDVGPYVTIRTERFGDPTEARLSTHIIGDPQWRGRDGQLLSVTARGDFSTDGWKLILVEDDWGSRVRRYSAQIPPEDLADWRELRLPLTRFVDNDGHSPSSWQVIDKLEVEAKAPRRSPLRLARLRWISGD